MGSPHWSYLLINHTVFPPCLFQWEHFAAAAPSKSLHSLTSSVAFVEHLNKAWWCQRAGFTKVSFSAKHLSMFLTFNALTCAQQGMSSKLSKGSGTSWTWSLGAWPCAAWPSMPGRESGQGRGVNTPVPLHWQGMTPGTVAAHSHHHAAGICTLYYPLDPERLWEMNPSWALQAVPILAESKSVCGYPDTLAPCATVGQWMLLQGDGEDMVWDKSCMVLKISHRPTQSWKSVAAQNEKHPRGQKQISAPVVPWLFTFENFKSSIH